MEMSNFNVRYVRLNKSCKIIILYPHAQNDLKFNIREVYFKEYESSVDIFYIIEEKKLYLKAINMQKDSFLDEIMYHIDILNTGHYAINENNIKKRADGLVDIKSIDKLEADMYVAEW